MRGIMTAWTWDFRDAPRSSPGPPAGSGWPRRGCWSGRRPSASNAASSVAKAAEPSLSRVYADAYASAGVLVNAVAPGATASELWTGRGGLAEQAAQRQGTTRDEALDAAAAKIPL